jgi:FemAB-related protein (PEP-CTERM system-associated)
VSGAGIAVEELAPGGEGEWDAFVAAHPGHSHYHRAGWAEVIRAAFGRRPLYRLARAGGRVEGVLPLVSFAHPFFGRYLVSVPFLNRGGLLFTTDRARDALLQEARALLQRTRSSFCELRHVRGIDPSLPARETKVSMGLDLRPGREALWKSIGPKVRNLVRKAERSGLAVREGEPARDLDAFYAVFASNMRDLGTPVYTPRFFRECFRVFPRNLRMNVVEREGHVAAAGICVREGDFVEMHWAASDRRELAHSPNMLLYWDAIGRAVDAGVGEFCFGRSTVDSGPYRFKRQWGAVPTPLRWEYLLAPGGRLPSLNPDNPRFRLATQVWRRLPLAVTLRLGPPIVRHLP